MYPWYLLGIELLMLDINGFFDTLDETLDCVVIWIFDDSLEVVWILYG